MKSVAYMYVWASSWSRCNRGAVQSDHTRLVLTRDTILHKMCQNSGLRQTHTAPLNSAPWRAAHIGEWRAVVGAGMIVKQVASKWSEQATCRSYYSCCTVLLLYCSLLYCKSVMSGFLSTWVGLLSKRVVLLSNGVDLFWERGFLKICPPPALSSHISSSPMGVFSRVYGTSISL